MMNARKERLRSLLGGLGGDAGEPAPAHVSPTQAAPTQATSGKQPAAPQGAAKDAARDAARDAVRDAGGRPHKDGQGRAARDAQDATATQPQQAQQETPQRTRAALPGQMSDLIAGSRRSSSAAVKAMGLSLGTLSQEAEEARRLRQALASGEQVVEIDPAQIEPSPFADRLSKAEIDDPEFEALQASIASHGQQVPVLLRPHADAEKAARGRYQIAYGHRRVEAARGLGRPVRAVVRALDDAALALAQGKENAERRALSFIERALFARTLLDHGFERATVQAALSVHKSEMSRLLQVAEAVPQDVVRAIGPAPRAGRPRWLALSELLANDHDGVAAAEMQTASFRAADSDARFQHLFNRLKAARGSPRKVEDKAVPIEGPLGQAIGELARHGKAARLTIPDSAGKGFADYVARQLPALHVAFTSAKEE